jgi:hypothetical protein
MNWRNPSRWIRAILVAVAYGVPGAMVGLMVGIWLPYPRLMFASGLLTGTVAGFWLELCG